MRTWEIEFRDTMVGKPDSMTVKAESVCCEGGTAFFYVRDESSKYGDSPRNRTIMVVPLDVVQTIREAG